MSNLDVWKAEIGTIPENTCPDIDSVIKYVDKASSLADTIYREYRRADCEGCVDCSDKAHDIDWELSKTYKILEALRKDNEQLRALGEYWYNKAKELLEADAGKGGVSE